jgi:hypothetical protein
MLLTPAARNILGVGLGGQFYMIVNAALGLSIATNAVTTMLIGYKLWYLLRYNLHEKHQ